MVPQTGRMRPPKTFTSCCLLPTVQKLLSLQFGPCMHCTSKNSYITTLTNRKIYYYDKLARHSSDRGSTEGIQLQMKILKNEKYTKIRFRQRSGRTTLFYHKNLINILFHMSDPPCRPNILGRNQAESIPRKQKQKVTDQF